MPDQTIVHSAKYEVSPIPGRCGESFSSREDCRVLLQIGDQGYSFTVDEANDLASQILDAEIGANVFRHFLKGMGCLS